MSKSSSIEFSTIKVFALAVLRIAIGWHFLFEGISKLFTPTWTSADFLLLSNWIFAGFFHWIAGNSALLGIADGVVTWTLIVIGLSLILGLLDRAASVAGMALIALFWLANPPLTGLDFGVPHEGNYLIVDKNLVEFFALLVLCLFPTGRYFGIDHFFYRKNATITPIEKEEKESQVKKNPNLTLVKCSTAEYCFAVYLHCLFWEYLAWHCVNKNNGKVMKKKIWWMQSPVPVQKPSIWQV